MEHFLQGNVMALCSNYEESLKYINKFDHEEFEYIRRLPSFRPYVESLQDYQKIIDILTDDEYLKKDLPGLLKECHVYFKVFSCFVEFLTVLVQDLPKCPLGKYRREVYTSCLNKDIIPSEEFQECWQILNFMSKEEFSKKIFEASGATLCFLEEHFEELTDIVSMRCKEIVGDILEKVQDQLHIVINAGTAISPDVDKENAPSDDLSQLNRQQLKEKLLQRAKEDKHVSEFSKAVESVLEFIKTEIVAKYLRPLSKAPALNEIFAFTDITTVRRNIVGSPRAALHVALNNPQFYLQCNCCDLESGNLTQTLPDLSVAYKLHLECGKMINMFDWLQAFGSVVDPIQDDGEEERQIDPKIQLVLFVFKYIFYLWNLFRARFTRAVAELQFLGYIKTSKRKMDHVTRLTW